MDVPAKKLTHFTPSLLGVYAFYVLWHIAIGALSSFPLYGDEAQYWVWGKNIDWGYYSKPPLIGWAIGGFTALFGDGPSTIRFLSVICHVCVAQGLVAFAHDRQARVPGSLFALTYLFMPGVSLSSHIVSTDPLLFVFYVWAMVWGYRFAEQPEGSSAVWFAFMIGLGLLAKYAMIWFVIMYPLGIWLSRKEFTPSKMFPYLPVILLVVGVFLLPNVYWNYANGWPTFSHTAGNVGAWGNVNLKNASVFVIAQFLMVGPLLAMHGLSHIRSGIKRPDVRFALGISIPVFVFVLIQALLNRSHANWAGVGHIGLVYVLVSSLAMAPAHLRRSIVTNVVIAFIMGVLSIVAYHEWLPRNINPFQRFYRTTRILNILKEQGIRVKDKVIVCDDRQLVAQLTYQLRKIDVAVVRYNPDFAPLDYFGMNTDMRVHPNRDRIFLGPTCLRQSKYINTPGRLHEQKLNLGKPFKPLCLQVFKARSMK